MFTCIISPDLFAKLSEYTNLALSSKKEQHDQTSDCFIKRKKMLYAILKALSYKLYITNTKSVTKYTPIVVHK